MSLENDIQKNATRGVDVNSTNSLDHIGHPLFEYVMAGAVIIGTAIGAYFGHRAGHPYYGAGIGAFLSGLVVNGAMEERYRYERGLEDNKQVPNLENID